MGGDYKAAWDGNVNSFYDYSQSDGGWTMAMISTPSVIGHIEFYPRSGFLERHVGGKFIGITTSGTQVTLATISATPGNGWSVSSGLTMSAVRYESPAGGYGNIAEIKLYTASSPGHYFPDVDGMVGVDTRADSGADPAMSGFGGGDYKAAWDGDINSFYDYSERDGGWTRATLATAAIIGHIEFYPRSDFLERYVGGKFIGITSAGDQVTLATVTSTPKSSWNGLLVGSGETITAIEYESPAGGYGNIAEIKAYTTSPTLV